jgi:hypothetical protein
MFCVWEVAVGLNQTNAGKNRGLTWAQRWIIHGPQQRIAQAISGQGVFANRAGVNREGIASEQGQLIGIALTLQGNVS